jgi:hypothetical protein
MAEAEGGIEGRFRRKGMKRTACRNSSTKNNTEAERNGLFFPGGNMAMAFGWEKKGISSSFC